MHSTRKAAEQAGPAHEANPTHPKFSNVLPRTFDPSNGACAKLWVMLIEGDCKISNYPFYHSCCNIFSRRRFAETNHFHPVDETDKMNIWRKFYKLSNVKKFTGFLLSQTLKREDKWFTIPGVDPLHNCDYPTKETRQSFKTKEEELDKRNAKLKPELEEMAAKYKRLKQTLLEEKEQRVQDHKTFDNMIQQLKDEGRLLLPPKPIFAPLPRFDRKGSRKQPRTAN